MADTKITALTAISTNPVNPATFPIPMVDLLDTSMAASGTTKKVTVNQILGAGGTATLASATITGDLTVRTNKLAVTSTGVGCGTATPANQLSVRNEGASGVSVIDVRGGTGGAGALQISGNGTTLGTTSFDFIQNGAGAFILNRDATPLAFSVNGAERYNIGTTGISTWSVAGTTAMTLNSTGLGIGTSPSYPLDVLGSSNVGILAVTCSSQVSSIRLRQTAVINVATRNWEINTNSTAYGNLEFRVGASAQSDTYSTAVTFDSSANIFAKGIAGTSLVTVTALATDYALPGGAFAGLIVIRSNGGGGSAVFMVDPNAGAVSISNNIVGRTITLTYSGGAWQFRQTVGAVPSTYNYLLLATQ